MFIENGSKRIAMYKLNLVEFTMVPLRNKAMTHCSVVKRTLDITYRQDFSYIRESYQQLRG
jgi:hypothetical protein